MSETANPTTNPTLSIEESLEHAKRAFALKKYEQAVQHYANALEQMTAEHGEDTPEIADVYFSYGKALLENAITQSSVLGKDQTDDALKEPEASSSGAFLSFSGDAEDAEGAEEPAVDLFAEAEKAVVDADAEGNAAEEEEEEDGEPEDDFNAAWEVLDLARAIYEKQQEDDDEIKLKLAETYIYLGDVSLETEKFEQAISDYEAGLNLKIELLPLSSRQIAEAHYKLAIVLDLSSGQLSEAIIHAEKALESVEARLAELRNGVSGQMKVETLPDKSDPKGKGKAPARGPRLLGSDAIQGMTKAQMEAEVKELEGLKGDLAAKVDELKTVPNEPVESAPAMAAKALDKELNAPSTVTNSTVPPVINDLTSIVKKKKKAPEPVDGANGATKRKSDDVEDGLSSPSEKKVKLDETAS
ncbi:hypothetical protein NLI96_g7346 [Meripilus lineatus]|uniref:Tetratricopeptide SHNi-TPR domain-containing protein n=1 Tax=Meripilus lineatus TaxID=2056292 RepID=A0AAD5UZD0_9APHY|nr:hypothetical protein NLI96_g7346 [Physisporinus lineatus]